MNGTKTGGKLLDILRIVIALAGTAIGAWYDLTNKKNVPDSFLYSFLFISLAINIFDPSLFFLGLPVAAVIILLLFLLYKLGQIGGADIIIIAAIYAALPRIKEPLLIRPEIQTVLEFFGGFNIPSIVSVILISTVIFAIYILIRYLPMAIRKTINGKVKFTTVNLLLSFILLLVYGFFLNTFWSLIEIFISVGYLIFVTFVVFLVIFFTLYKDTITESMIKMRRDVEEDDILAMEKVDEKTMKKLNLGRLVTKEQLLRMKKLKRKWPVLDLPFFLPFILLGLILYILIGDPLLYSL